MKNLTIAISSQNIQTSWSSESGAAEIHLGVGHSLGHSE